MSAVVTVPNPSARPMFVRARRILPAPPETPRICLVCGTPIAGRKKAAKTCGDKCRQQLSRDKRALGGRDE